MNKKVNVDANALGSVSNLHKISMFGLASSHKTTDAAQTLENIGDAYIISSKVVLDKKNILDCPNLKLICISTT